MPLQHKVGRTGLAISTGTVALVLAGPATAAGAGECPPGEGLVSTLTGVICAATDTVAGAGGQAVDGATGGASAPVTGAVKDGADGLAGGVHGTAAAAERTAHGARTGDRAGAERRRPVRHKRAAKPTEPTWTSFPGGYTPLERMRYLDSRFPARSPGVLAPPAAPGSPGWSNPNALPEPRLPRVAPWHPHIAAAPHPREGARPISLSGTGGQPTTIAIAAGAATAGVVVAMHLGFVDTWRRRRPRRDDT
jgi:hypothetical protein